MKRGDCPNDNGCNTTEDNIKKSIFHDEDDQRQQDTTCKDPKANKIPGSNLTRYSMWGQYCPHYKGYGNGNPDMLAMNASLGAGKLAPLRRSPKAVSLQKQISEWWGNEKYTSPKRKRKKEPKQMVVKKEKGPICQIITDDVDEEVWYNNKVAVRVIFLGPLWNQTSLLLK